MMIMVIGALMFSWTESAFSWVGLGLVIVNTLSACMVINNSLGMLPTLMIAGISNEFEGFQESGANWRDPGVIALVIMSGFMGLGIGLAGLMCQKAMSATSFQVLQNMSKVAVVVVAVQVFGD